MGVILLLAQVLFHDTGTMVVECASWVKNCGNTNGSYAWPYEDESGVEKVLYKVGGEWVVITMEELKKTQQNQPKTPNP